jgi:hypothetical protein
MKRIVLGPHPKSNSPCSKARRSNVSRSASALSLHPLSFTNSTPIINPLPRTSPIAGCRICISRRRASICSPSVAAFSMYPPCNSRIVVCEATQANGLPPYVLLCAPGGQVINCLRPTIAPSGIPEAIALARQTMSGSTPQCSTANILPVRPKPDCTSSATSSMP